MFEKSKETDIGASESANQKAAIRSIVGIVPSDSKIIEHYLEEKVKERASLKMMREEPLKADGKPLKRDELYK